jgi:SAM-dependent methyltransferase
LPDGIKYLGLEFNDRAIQKARARGLDVRSLPLEDVARDMPACFDLICAFQVLEHVPNPRQFLMDMVTSLKTGGVILFSVPSENSFLQYEVNNLTNIPPHHSTRWPDNTFKKLTDILNVDLVSVIHEDLSYADRRAYAKTQVWRIISFFTPLGRNKISPIATQIWFRFLVLFASLPFSLHLFIVKKLPPGHTVTVTLKKR